jgi:hypothetical protein
MLENICNTNDYQGVIALNKELHSNQREKDK